MIVCFQFTCSNCPCALPIARIHGGGCCLPHRVCRAQVARIGNDVDDSDGCCFEYRGRGERCACLITMAVHSRGVCRAPPTARPIPSRFLLDHVRQSRIIVWRRRVALAEFWLHGSMAVHQ